jgi:hypothetical protein
MTSGLSVGQTHSESQVLIGEAQRSISTRCHSGTIIPPTHTHTHSQHRSTGGSFCSMPYSLSRTRKSRLKTMNFGQVQAITLFDNLFGETILPARMHNNHDQATRHGKQPVPEDESAEQNKIAQPRPGGRNREGCLVDELLELGASSHYCTRRWTKQRPRLSMSFVANHY